MIIKRKIVEVWVLHNNSKYPVPLEINLHKDYTHLHIAVEGIAFDVNGIDAWEALRQLGVLAREKGINILCKGLTLGVYPSRMSRQMGLGTKAYQITSAKTARRDDIIDIFDYTDESNVNDPLDQDLFYEKWIKSLN